MSTDTAMLVDQGIDPDRLMLEGINPNKLMLDGIDTSDGPLYSVSEMARFFFDRTSHWVRWLETCHYSMTIPHPKRPGRTLRQPCGIAVSKHGNAPVDHKKTWKLVFDGEMLTPLRTESNARMYDLALIEKMAHSLASNATITMTQMHHALILVRVQAEMHQYI